MNEPATIRGKKAPVQPGRIPGIIDAIILRKDPLVEGPASELERVKAERDKAVLAFGDEVVAHRHTLGLLDVERTLTRALEERLGQEIAERKRLEGRLGLRAD